MNRRKRESHEVTVDQEIGGYKLPDYSIDLSAWLRDGLEVYNLFVLMKPLFFQMLEAHGGDFEAAYSKINDDGKRWSLRMGERVPEGGDTITDRVIFATLIDRDQTTDPPPKARHYDLQPLPATDSEGSARDGE